LVRYTFTAFACASWLRRSNATTGAEWLKTRFGLTDKGVGQSHKVVVAFALILCIGYMAYAFVGVGEFLQIFLPYEKIKDTFPFLIMEKQPLLLVLINTVQRLKFPNTVRRNFMAFPFASLL